MTVNLKTKVLLIVAFLGLYVFALWFILNLAPIPFVGYIACP